MKFSFDEEARRELTGFFGGAMNDAGTETQKLFEGLVEIYRREQYKPLCDMTEEIANYYVDDFRRIVLKQFEQWLESETSVHAFAQELEASEENYDDSYRAARELEAVFQELLDELFSNRPDTPSVSTEARLTKEVHEIFEEVDEQIRKFKETMEELIFDYSSRAMQRIEDNQLYENISEVIGAVLEAYKSLFDMFNQGVLNLAGHLNIKGFLAKVKSINDTVQMRAEAETAGEALRDVSDLFDF